MLHRGPGIDSPRDMSQKKGLAGWSMGKYLSSISEGGMFDKCGALVVTSGSNRLSPPGGGAWEPPIFYALPLRAFWTPQAGQV
jgi:hypothetical protein